MSRKIDENMKKILDVFSSEKHKSLEDLRKETDLPMFVIKKAVDKLLDLGIDILKEIKNGKK